MPRKGQVKKFNKLLLDWTAHGLRDFPWRHDRTPFSIYVAELLLKRTTSTAALRVYGPFLEKYPTILSISEADEGDLVEVLRPIGLHKQRAKGFLESANVIVKKYNGEFPEDFGQLSEIPHIGPYTAACILSFGMDIPVPAVDSNVMRVLKNVFQRSLPEKAGINDYFELAQSIIPEDRHAEFNYGLIDLGAVICSYRGCKKELCPFKDICDSCRN
jgi:A/G-specific adenine glycosylase